MNVTNYYLIHVLVIIDCLQSFPLCLTSKLQAMLLQQQSFLQKCEAWMDFLSQTEQKLAAEISGNYQSLLEQQQDHEVRALKAQA